MIVCSCARVTDRDIRYAVAWMRAADPQAVITPGKVYRALGKKPVCGGCVALFVAKMERGLQVGVPAELLGLKHDLQGTAHEGRDERHRVSEQGAAERVDRGQPVLAALSPAE